MDSHRSLYSPRLAVPKFAVLSLATLVLLFPTFSHAQYAPQAQPPAPVSAGDYGQYAPDEEPGYAPQSNGYAPQPNYSQQQNYAQPGYAQPNYAQPAQQAYDPSMTNGDPQYGGQPGPYNAPPTAAQMQSQPALSTEQLEQLVAPIALYPDSLVAQILAAATYPAQVVDADHWLRTMAGAGPEQIVAGADAQSWDPSIKSLTAVPDLLAQMGQNVRWTIALGNAYYNEPQAILDVIQVMRQRAQAAGNLASGAQEQVTGDQGYIQITSVDPTLMYLPVYNPWTVYGAPVAPYRGFSFFGALGNFLSTGFGANAIRWGGGIAMGAFMHSPFGLLSWGLDWLAHTLLFHNSGYYSHSATLVDWGLPHGGPRAPYYHGIYNRPGYHAPAYHAYGNTLRAGAVYSRQPGFIPRTNSGFNTAREEANAHMQNGGGFAGRGVGQRSDPRSGQYSDPRFGNAPQGSFNRNANQQVWNHAPERQARPAFGGRSQQLNSPGQNFGQRQPAYSGSNPGSYAGNNSNRSYAGQSARTGFGNQQAYRGASPSFGRDGMSGGRQGNSFGRNERSEGSRSYGGGGFKEPKAAKEPKAPKAPKEHGSSHEGGGHGGGGHSGGHHH